MTGKYDQFAWGWDDAELDGAVWDDYVALDTVPRKVITTSDVPTSENREIYEGMRNAANDEYSKSMRFIFGIMANHLVSAFEAYFVTKSRNNAMRYEQEFAARWYIDAGLRSYHTTSDTPYLTVGYKF